MFLSLSDCVNTLTNDMKTEQEKDTNVRVLDVLAIRGVVV